MDSSKNLKGLHQATEILDNLVKVYFPDLHDYF